VSAVLFLTNLFSQAIAVVFVPLWVYTIMHSPVALGYVATAFGLGAILGAAIFTAVAPHVPRYPSVVVGFLVGSSPRMLVLVLSNNLVVVIAVTFVCGVATCATNPAIQAMMYQRIPAHLLARVAGISLAIMFGGIPLGALIGGVTVQTLGYTSAGMLLWVLYFVCSLAPVALFHTWRELNDTNIKPSVQVGQALPRLYALGATTFGLRVTLRYLDGRWWVDARSGLRPLVARQLIEPKIVMAGLSWLSMTEVHAAVRETLSGERVAVEHAAAALRERLAALPMAELSR
jgi:MFS family permease